MTRLPVANVTFSLESIVIATASALSSIPIEVNATVVVIAPEVLIPTSYSSWFVPTASLAIWDESILASTY